MRLSVVIVDVVEGAYDVIHTVTVHQNDVPTEGSPSVVDIVDRHYILCVATDLQVIAVYDCHEIVEMIAIGSHCRLVDRPFAPLPIAPQDIGSPWLVVHYCSV